MEKEILNKQHIKEETYSIGNHYIENDLIMENPNNESGKSRFDKNKDNSNLYSPLKESQTRPTSRHHVKFENASRLSYRHSIARINNVTTNPTKQAIPDKNNTIVVNGVERKLRPPVIAFKFTKQLIENKMEAIEAELIKQDRPKHTNRFEYRKKSVRPQTMSIEDNFIKQNLTFAHSIKQEGSKSRRSWNLFNITKELKKLSSKSNDENAKNYI